MLLKITNKAANSIRPIRSLRAYDQRVSLFCLMKYLEVADVALVSIPLIQLRVLAAWSAISSQYFSVCETGILAVPICIAINKVGILC